MEKNKPHEYVHPSCRVSTLQAGGAGGAGGAGVMVLGVFSRHTLGPLIWIHHCATQATRYTCESQRKHSIKMQPCQVTVTSRHGRQ